MCPWNLNWRFRTWLIRGLVHRSVCHGIYRHDHGVWGMILSFDVELDPVAGGRKGVDFTFHVMRYHPRFTVIKEGGHAGGHIIFQNCLFFK